MSKIAYHIVSFREVPSAAPGREGKMDAVVLWEEDGLRPYALVLPAEEATPENIRAKIEAEVLKHSAIIGLSGEVGS